MEMVIVFTMNVHVLVVGRYVIENEFDNFINLTKILQGPYCNETWCSDDSCGAGVCINGEYCDCPPNHYGADCSWGKYLKSVAFRILKSS